MSRDSPTLDEQFGIGAEAADAEAIREDFTQFDKILIWLRRRIFCFHNWQRDETGWGEDCLKCGARYQGTPIGWFRER